jgi:hypothetical protein
LSRVPNQLAVGVFDSQQWFVEVPEDESSEVNVPEGVAGVLERDVFLGEDVADIDLVVVPAAPAVVTHAPDVPIGRILELRQRSGNGRSEAR